MSKPDHSIDPRILQSAKNEFLSKGYEKASLKNICENANITTGALYKRYKGKEDLFCAIVDETVVELKKIIEEKCAIPVENLTDEQLLESWRMGESMLWWFKILNNHNENFVLLISCADGTKYSNFQHDWVELMTEKSHEYFLETKRRNFTNADISKSEMHILLSAFWTTIYEPFIHGYNWNQIESHNKLICNLFNWEKVLGLSTE